MSNSKLKAYMFKNDYKQGHGKCYIAEHKSQAYGISFLYLTGELPAEATQQFRKYLNQLENSSNNLLEVPEVNWTEYNIPIYAEDGFIQDPGLTLSEYITDCDCDGNLSNKIETRIVNIEILIDDCELLEEII